MKNYRIKQLFIFAVLTLMLTGCFAVDGYFKGVRNMVLKNVGTTFDKEIEFGVGAAGIMMGSMVVSFSDAEYYIDDMMRKIDRVQVGVYKKSNLDRKKTGFSELKKITDVLKEDDYKFIVRSYDRNEMVAVMVKNNSNYTLNEMFVVTLSNDELVIAQIFGDLDELIEIAIREEGFNVEVAKN